MSEVAKFFAEVSQNIESLARDLPLQGLSNIWIREITRHKYSYNFTWMGRPIIQFPQDIIAMQEIIWSTRPDIIIETEWHMEALSFFMPQCSSCSEASVR
jgi:cephalosporin hydroxylase